MVSRNHLRVLPRQAKQLSFLDFIYSSDGEKDNRFRAPIPAVTQPALTHYSPSDPINQLLPEYRRYLLGRQRSASTADDFVRDLTQLAEYYPGRAVSSYSTADLTTFLGYLIYNRMRSLKTVERKISALKNFFAFVKELGLRRDNPALRLIYPTITEPLPNILRGESEVARLIAVLRQPIWRALVLLFLETGLKRDEALRLTRADLVLDGSRPHLMVRRPPGARYVQSRVLDITPALLDALKDYLNTTQIKGPIFPIHVRTIHWKLTELGKSAGLETRLSAQLLRDTFAVRWLAKRMPTENSPDDIRRNDQRLLELLGLAPNSFETTIPKYRTLASRWNT